MDVLFAKIVHLIKKIIKFDNMTLNCHTFLTVHELHPADIDVVAAIGDSITVSGTIMVSQYIHTYRYN